ncbi:MAG: LPS export ABC transporter periplasmic protein LptC [Treponema sp.]|nr:LPS export ABC transporter periplasmic protein LptC [Candidatus Treponema merdequi]
MQGSVSNSKESSKQNSTILSGNAIVKTSTMEIKADSIELTGNDFDIIKASGNIKGTNTESELEFSAETLEYNRETKIVVLSGGVELKDLKNDVTAKAQIIEYDQNTDVAIMQIDVELKQKQNVCTGAYSVYRKKEQTLELSGNASVKQSDDTFRAQYISFDMDTEEIVMDGNIRGTVTTKKTESE